VNPASSLQHVVLDKTLWGLALPPVVGALAAFAVAVREERSPAGDLRRAGVRRRVAIVAAGCAALSFALVVSRVARIADMPESARVLVDHVLRLARVGSFEANLDFTFDPVGAVATGAIAFAGTVTLALGARADAERSAQTTGAISLAVAALLLASLASEGVVMLAALDLCALALVVASDARSRLLRAALGGGTLLAAGLAIVFWGLGGGWAGGDYTVDFSPRVVAVRAPAPAGEDVGDDATGMGLLTMSTHPGAVVFLDDARTPVLDGDHALRSPFVRHAIASGRHTIRVHSGAGADDFVVADAIAAAGEEMTIAWVGPTTSFRELRDSLEIHDDLGKAPVREAFLGRELVSGLPVVDAASVLLVGGVGVSALAIAAAARRRDAGLLGDAALLATVWYVAARVDPLLALAPLARGVLAVTACVAWVAAAWRLRRGRPLSHGLTALVLLGAAVRAAPFGGIVVTSGVLALASTALSRDGRAKGISDSALAGAPLPLLGVAWGAFGILDAVWTTPPGGRPLGAPIVLASLVGAFLVTASSRRAKASGALQPLSLGLAVAAAAIGPLLGASRGWLGERGAPAVTHLLEPFVTAWANGGRSHSVAVAFAWSGAALGGWAYAQRRPTPLAVLAPTIEEEDADDVTGVTRAGLDLVLGFERWVVEATVGGVVNCARAIGWAVSQAGAAAVDRPSNGAARVLHDVGRRSSAARVGMMLAVVATLALAALAAR
jgi:hypothetical protein